MANTNFLQFDSQAMNMLDDENYLADAQRVSGVSTGLARSLLYNKQAFQASTMAVALANVMVANGKDAMDNNLTSLTENLLNTFVTTGQNNTFTRQNIFLGDLIRSGNTDPGIKIKIANYTRGTNPSVPSSGNLKIVDGSDQLLGNIYRYIDGFGNISMGMQTLNKDGSTSANFDIGYKSNGSFYSYLPACDMANSIVTTTAISRARNGYVKLGNGIIIQWGLATTASGTGTKQVTLPTAFSNTNYEVVVTGVQTSYSNDYVGAVEVQSQTSLGFTIYSCGYSQARWIAIGY